MDVSGKIAANGRCLITQFVLVNNTRRIYEYATFYVVSRACSPFIALLFSSIYAFNVGLVRIYIE